MGDEREAFKSLLVVYASRYGVELPSVVGQARLRFSSLSSDEVQPFARDLLVELIQDGTIGLFRPADVDMFVESEQAVARLHSHEAWVASEGGDFVAATALGESIAESSPEDYWLEWEYPTTG